MNFDRSLPRTNTSHNGPRGTPGYQPDGAHYYDGDVSSDIYSLVAVIMECDMGLNEYVKIKD